MKIVNYDDLFDGLTRSEQSSQAPIATTTLAAATASITTAKTPIENLTERYIESAISIACCVVFYLSKRFLQWLFEYCRRRIDSPNCETNAQQTEQTEQAQPIATETLLDLNQPSVEIPKQEFLPAQNLDLY
jgi:hypothetical protein